MTAYETAVQNLAAGARVAIEYGMSREDAVKLAADNAVKDGHAARTRDGHWARESTTEQIDGATFLAAVARDVLDGTVTRPSVGNVRDALLAELEEDATPKCIGCGKRPWGFGYCGEECKQCAAEADRAEQAN